MTRVYSDCQLLVQTLVQTELWRHQSRLRVGRLIHRRRPHRAVTRIIHEALRIGRSCVRELLV